jgi:diadenosine tetraphosphate (Ap4A) HIT family hydrolase
VSACLFCEIVAGHSPASVVYRDEFCLAFMDLFPVTAGHVLVVPIAHATYLADLPADTGAAMFRTAQRLAAAVRGSGVRADGITLILADGAAAGQEIFHSHLHVVPRFAGDGFGLRFPPGYPREAPRPELDEHAQMIRRAL